MHTLLKSAVCFDIVSNLALNTHRPYRKIRLHNLIHNISFLFEIFQIWLEHSELDLMVFSQHGEIDRDLRVANEERLLKIYADGFIEQVLVNKRTYFVPIFSQNDLHVIQDRWIFSDDPSYQQYLHNFEIKIIPAFSQLNPILLLPLFLVTTKIYITRNRTFQSLL